MSGETHHDLVVVGAGPAGSATALGALAVDPTLRVLLLDRADFPRDKSCGDGVAPHVLDALGEVGVTGLLDDWTPVARLRLSRDGLAVDRAMVRPTWVVPRRVLDARLVEAAQAAGARLQRARVKGVSAGATRAVVTTADGDELTAAVAVGADGAHSVVRRALGLAPGPMALALRGYAPVVPGTEGAQVIVFGGHAQPAYAWSFDRGDGLANVGYGELLPGGDRPPTSKQRLRERLDELLPGSAEGGTDWLGHHLPLSRPRWRPTPGRVLLAGDAAGLVNPMTGEGIYDAVATGIAAGRAAAHAVRAGEPASAGRRYARTPGPALPRHLRHIAAAAALSRSGRVLDAGLRAAVRDQRLFDDLVELGLAHGRITARVAGGLATQLAGGLVADLRGAPRTHATPRRRSPTTCAS
ncbi:geranylgeranyl reductase family protein [Nocardioides marinquilinus]|uniref:Geranylgeranyl reductase family protein n=1 Tax=Nocardioides marinquilinus TaxID=1210400 RepID=A0ABP9PHR7_9ACTN